MFSSNYDLEQEVYRFTRNECNKEIMYAILKKLKTTNEQIEYALYVNLPKMLRNTNITPYSILDCTKYASVYQFLFDQLTQLFGMNIPELIVTGIECSFSYTLANKKLLNPMLNYITRAFISKNKGMHVYVKGVQSKDINIVLNVKNATTNDSESWNDDTSELDNWGEDDIYK